MPIDERTKRENKRKRKQYVSIIKAAAMFVLCIVGLFFMLNDKVWHIGGVPTSEDVIRFFGGGAKPYVKLSNGEASVSFIDVGQGAVSLSEPISTTFLLTAVTMTEKMMLSVF